MTDLSPKAAGPDDVNNEPTPVFDYADQTDTEGSELPDGLRGKGNLSPRERSEELEEQRLREMQLELIRRYERDALRREDPLEAVVASANAGVLELRLRLDQALKEGLAAESFSLDAYEEYGMHMKELHKLTNQVHQLSQLELKIQRKPPLDPFIRRGPSAPR